MNTANGVVGRVLAKFESVKRSGKGWKTRCPCHDDRVDSLMIDVGDDGRALLHCHAGCATADIVGKIGLQMSDIMAQNGHVSVHTDNGKPKIIATYDYRDESGELLYQVCRFEPKDFRQRKPADGGGWDWSTKGVRKVLYRLPELRDAIEGAGESPPTVFVPEGEKDCDRLRSIGLVATCNAGGAGKWQQSYSDALAGCRVIVLPDNDKAGRDHVAAVARMTPGATVLELPGLPDKGDVSDWIDAGGTAQQLFALVEAASCQNDNLKTPDEFEPILFGQLADENPTLDPPVIDGLLRRGETANIVSLSKVGKSWLADHLALCVVTGRKFLETFDCAAGNVLLIDNELKKPSIVFRINQVAEAMGIESPRLGLSVLPLRGRRKDINGVAAILERRQPGEFGLIVADAWYRMLPPGISENDNAAIMDMYNTIDQIAARLDCCWVNIHHTSKGGQSDKVVTDVGAGAGAQSRAADSHLILRPHEEEGAVVLDAAVRSFPKVESLALRWQFPLWRPDDSLDPAKLKGKLTAGEQRQKEHDLEGIGKLAEAIAKGPATARDLRNRTGLSRERIERLLAMLIADRAVTVSEIEVRGNKCDQYRIANHEDK